MAAVTNTYCRLLKKGHRDHKQMNDHFLFLAADTLDELRDSVKVDALMMPNVNI